jgi:hypothetical protein
MNDVHDEVASSFVGGNHESESELQPTSSTIGGEGGADMADVAVAAAGVTHSSSTLSPRCSATD